MDRRKFLKHSGWSLLGLAAAATAPSCAFAFGDNQRDSPPATWKNNMPSLDDFKMFIGDLHNHCNVTYGHGDLADAIAAAEQQLDFASINPPRLVARYPRADDPRLGWVIGYHTEAFDRLRRGGYEKYRAAIEAANRPGKFETFVSRMSLDGTRRPRGSVPRL